MPDPMYMDNQVELQWKMRQILNDWMVEVHSKFRLLPETLLIAINLIDRFLSARTVSLEKFQLVGLTALFVAAKYEEVICPSVTHFLNMADGGYDVDEILRAERYLLQTLDFDLAYPNPLHFLRRVSKADRYDVHSRTVAKFFIEISCLDHRLLPYPPSLLAAAAMWIARLCFDRGPWHANMVHYSTYAQHELLDCAQVMLDFVVDPDLDVGTAFFKKYAGRVSTHTPRKQRLTSETPQGFCLRARLGPAPLARLCPGPLAEPGPRARSRVWWRTAGAPTSFKPLPRPLSAAWFTTCHDPTDTHSSSTISKLNIIPTSTSNLSRVPTQCRRSPTLSCSQTLHCMAPVPV